MRSIYLVCRLVAVTALTVTPGGDWRHGSSQNSDGASSVASLIRKEASHTGQDPIDDAGNYGDVGSWNAPQGCSDQSVIEGNWCMGWCLPHGELLAEQAGYTPGSCESKGFPEKVHDLYEDIFTERQSTYPESGTWAVDAHRCNPYKVRRHSVCE